MEKVINIQENINPHFKDVWLTDKPYNIMSGGRNSFKSSVAALKLVSMMMDHLAKGETVNIVVLRKVAATIMESVQPTIMWAIDLFGMSGEFKVTQKPMRITHNKTKSSFRFYGLDDFQKLKSNKIGNIIALWYEEAAEFDSREDFDQTNITFMRQQYEGVKHVTFFWSFNPPRNPYHWINEWVQEMEDEEDYLVHRSSYLNDELGFVTEQMLADINRIKRNDFDYYRYLYLGHAVGLGNNVYNIDLFKEWKGLEPGERFVALYYSADGGHSQSATTAGCYAWTSKRNLVLLNTYYYSPAGRAVKKAPNDLSEDLYNFIRLTSTHQMVRGARIANRTIDSAEAAIRNQYYKDYGQHLNPVAKKKKVDMIDYVHALLADGRFYYAKNDMAIALPHANKNDIFIEEHKKFSWNPKYMDTADPKVIEEDDHTVDQFIYVCLDNARALGLKV